jgi:hypothetical protein
MKMTSALIKENVDSADLDEVPSLAFHWINDENCFFFRKNGYGFGGYAAA